jgi:hypothetical protein
VDCNSQKSSLDIFQFSDHAVTCSPKSNIASEVYMSRDGIDKLQGLFTEHGLFVLVISRKLKRSLTTWTNKIRWATSKMLAVQYLKVSANAHHLLINQRRAKLSVNSTP